MGSVFCINSWLTFSQVQDEDLDFVMDYSILSRNDFDCTPGFWFWNVHERPFSGPSRQSLLAHPFSSSSCKFSTKHAYDFIWSRSSSCHCQLARYSRQKPKVPLDTCQSFTSKPRRRTTKPQRGYCLIADEHGGLWTLSLFRELPYVFEIQTTSPPRWSLLNL